MVAVYFIINSFLADSIEVISIWRVLNILMVIGLALALMFNYLRKREEDASDSGRSDYSPLLRGQRGLLPYRGRHDSVFCTTGSRCWPWVKDSLDGNHQAWIMWAAVDVTAAAGSVRHGMPHVAGRIPVLAGGS